MPTLQDLVEQARQIADDITSNEADQIDAEYRWPERTMTALRDGGLTGLNVPMNVGGLGQGLRALTEVSETLAYHSGSAGLTFGMHCVGTAVIAAKASGDHQRQYLKAIAAGDHITSLALSEPGTGSNFWLPTTQMTQDGDEFIVNGGKAFVTNGNHADSYVLSVASVEPEGDGHFSCVVLDNDSPGMTWGEPWSGLGMRGNSSIPLKLDNVRLPTQALLGEPGDQIWYVFQVVAPFFLCAMTGTYLGIAARAVDEAISSLKHRTFSHTARSASSIDVLQQRLARIWAKVESTRRLTYWAADEGDTGGHKALPALTSAKAEVARTVVEAVHESLALSGGSGYQSNGLSDRLMRDALAADIMSPTTDLLQLWAGRALLERPLLSE